MPVLPRPIANQETTPLLGRTLELRWTATPPRQGAREQPLAYVVTLTFVDDRHGVLTAWSERDEKPLIERQPVACRAVVDGDLLHVDARRDRQPVLAATLRGEDRLLYARTPILLDAGIAPGACDPPRGRLRAAQRDAASA